MLNKNDPATGGEEEISFEIPNSNKLHQLYSFICKVNQMIARSTNEEALFKDVCKIAVDVGKFSMAWIGMIDEKAQKIIPVTLTREDADYFSKSKIISTGIPGSWWKDGALHEGKCIVCNDVEKDLQLSSTIEEAMSRGYLSSISLPVKKSGKIIVAFTLYANTKNYFNAEEISLLEETVSDISFALETLEKEILRKKQKR